jgi:DNA-binding transcriptional LysR family regulator
MNFQQLRILREAVRCNFNLTEVAAALDTSKSGVSKHIKDLEDELGVTLFERHGKRLLGLIGPGHELIGIVDRILNDVANVRRLAQRFSQSSASAWASSRPWLQRTRQGTTAARLRPFVRYADLAHRYASRALSARLCLSLH